MMMRTWKLVQLDINALLDEPIMQTARLRRLSRSIESLDNNEGASLYHDPLCLSVEPINTSILVSNTYKLSWRALTSQMRHTKPRSLRVNAPAPSQFSPNATNLAFAMRMTS